MIAYDSHKGSLLLVNWHLYRLDPPSLPPKRDASTPRFPFVRISQYIDYAAGFLVLINSFALMPFGAGGYRSLHSWKPLRFFCLYSDCIATWWICIMNLDLLMIIKLYTRVCSCWVRKMDMNLDRFCFAFIFIGSAQLISRCPVVWNKSRDPFGRPLPVNLNFSRFPKFKSPCSKKPVHLKEPAKLRKRWETCLNHHLPNIMVITINSRKNHH